ncbi:hypothetical protein JCM11641_003218 [Rhodosporidiobolus odoratus]
MSIQVIDRTSIHRLTSGQVVIDLTTAVKELVENALDAEATSLKITFRDQGLEAIEVEDNGKGIDKEDWAGIALKHHTSKLSSFSDLALVSTLGFRGEALSSLCGTATLSMLTATAATTPMGTNLTFTSAGDCVVGGKTARPKGTTVKVGRLFENLPVRRKELVKNSKREFGKALELIQAYAIINAKVRFEVRNAVKGKGLAIHLQTNPAASIRSTFSSIYTPKSLTSLLDLDLTLDVATEKSVLKRLDSVTESSTTVRVKGLISKPSSPHGRTAGNRQFYYINGRPFSPSKVGKAVNEVYKSFNAQQFPTVVADFQLATDAYDVNVSPDKRTIFLHSEGNLIAAMKTALEAFFQPSQATFAMTQIGASKGAISSSSATASPSGSQTPKRVEKEGETEELERPRKRRKSSPDLEIEAERAEPSVASQARTEDAVDNKDEAEVSGDFVQSMDIDLDAAFLSGDPSSSIFANGAAFAGPAYPPPPPGFLPSDSFSAGYMSPLYDVDPVLPIPPSPIRRAHPSSPPRPASHTNEDQGTATPSEILHRPEARPTSPRPAPAAAPSPSQAIPLFRSSPSPSPRPPSPSLSRTGSRSRSPTPRAPSPSPAQPERRAPLLAPNLKQPKLAFLPSSFPSTSAAPSSANLNAIGRGKGRGKGKEPMRAMANHLQRFLKGSSAAGGGEEEDEESGDGRQPEEGMEEERDDVENDESAEGGAEEEGEDGDLTFVEDSQNATLAAVKGSGDTETGHGEEGQHVTEEIEEEDRFPVASCACVHGSQLANDNDDDDDDALEIQEPPPVSKVTASLDVAPEELLPFGSAPAEVAGTVVAADTTLAFDCSAIESAWSTPLPSSSVSAKQKKAHEDHEDGLAAAGVGENENEAEATLSRVVSKLDFERMEVLGQFNLGFIIARRRIQAAREDEGSEEEKGNEEGDVQDDLFIIDQHASDEKYNFEKLREETMIQSQRLLAPRTLSLPSHDEITAMENLDLLRLNGFEVLVDEDADVGERVKLLAQPVSKETIFGPGDFEELLDLIANRSSEREIVRPTKTRRMFASRACRKSVMIGKALNAKQMTQIIQHMGGMDQPWSCPHGRPTMRWLHALDTSSRHDSRSNLVKLRQSYT